MRALEPDQASVEIGPFGAERRNQPIGVRRLLRANRR
jgi:hypothetical protein